ncbi:MAG: 30S ribosomal protein S16 [Candidatus Komeilibacteria bacterium RIFCSPLOWO2_01_FULL_52_15]|nr:MAG: 30S ribosomal protein S16 [Candidatus Komeilibacteria bacterium RIFCSPLOWO2_01_FULL_52_15]
MLTIRFARIGTRKKPFFRIIISEKSKDTQGQYLELLGHYNPRTKEVTLKTDRITYWLGLGATASNSVYNLLVNQKIVHADKKRRSVHISKKRAAKLEEAKKAAAPEAPAQVVEAPAQPEKDAVEAKQPPEGKPSEPAN